MTYIFKHLQFDTAPDCAKCKLCGEHPDKLDKCPADSTYFCDENCEHYSEEWV